MGKRPIGKTLQPIFLLMCIQVPNNVHVNLRANFTEVIKIVEQFEEENDKLTKKQKLKTLVH